MSVSLVISVKNQELYVCQGGQVLTVYPVSTAKQGVGCEMGSGKTPWGRFVVAEKIGEGCAEGMIFQSRQPMRLMENQDKLSDKDLITSRILWLSGVDVHNSQTKSRYIYIHGTNREDLLGTPCSHGCVRLSNRAVIDVFDKVEVGTYVQISRL